jgi:hypothetical protein
MLKLLKQIKKPELQKAAHGQLVLHICSVVEEKLSPKKKVAVTLGLEWL